MLLHRALVVRFIGEFWRRGEQAGESLSEVWLCTVARVLWLRVRHTLPDPAGALAVGQLRRRSVCHALPRAAVDYSLPISPAKAALSGIPAQIILITALRSIR